MQYNMNEESGASAEVNAKLRERQDHDKFMKESKEIRKLERKGWCFKFSTVHAAQI